MKRFIFLIVATFFVTTIHAEHKTIYKKIQPINLASLTWEDEDWPHESFHDHLLRCLEYQKNPQEIKKRRIVFRIFDELTKDNTPAYNVLYDMTTAQDLGLLSGQSEGEQYVSQIIDRTHMQLGKVFLYGLLSSPTDDIYLLMNRQETIKLLLEDEDLYNALNDLYWQLGSAENMLLSLWAQDGFLNITQRQFYALPFLSTINKRLNRSAFFLELKSLWDHQNRAVFLTAGIFASVILPLYGLSQISSFKISQGLEEVARPLQGSGGRIYGLLASVNNKWVRAGAAIAGGIGCALFSSEDYECARDNFILDRCIQEKMITIARFINSIKSMQKLLEARPELCNRCAGAAYIHNFMQQHSNDESFKQLFDYCDSSTLQGDPSYLLLPWKGFSNLSVNL